MARIKGQQKKRSQNRNSERSQNRNSGSKKNTVPKSSKKKKRNHDAPITKYSLQAQTVKKLNRQNLVGYDFSGGYLVSATFYESKLMNAEFRNAALKNAIFTRADLRNARFSNADLEGASFIGADLRGTSFVGAVLKRANFTDALIEDTNFKGVDLTGAKGIQTVSSASEFITKPSISISNIDNPRRIFDSGVETWNEWRKESVGGKIVLGRLSIVGKQLAAIDLSGIDLSYADLSRCDLSFANLSGSKLQNAQLSRAKLCQADLSDADMTNASLYGADLSNAVLTNVCFYGVDLRSVIGLSPEDLNCVRINEFTKTDNILKSTFSVPFSDESLKQNESNRERVAPLRTSDKQEKIIQENYTEFRQFCEARWREITTDRTSGISPNGDDLIEVNIAPLLKLKIYYVRFLQENHTPPEVAVHLILESDQIVICRINRMGDLVFIGESPKWCSEPTKMLLQACVLSFYSDLVLEPEEIWAENSHRSHGDISSGHKDHKNYLPRKRWHTRRKYTNKNSRSRKGSSVRPHRRKLQEGHQASPNQIREAAIAGVYLPDNDYTFVRAHIRGSGGDKVYKYSASDQALSAFLSTLGF